MFERRAQVLADRENPAAVFQQVVHRREDFRFAFAEAQHQAAFGRGTPAGDVFQYVEADPVFGARTYLRREAFDRLDVVPHDVGRRGENDIDQFFLAVEIGDQYLYGGIGVGFPYGTHGSGPMGGTPVGQVIPVHGGNYAMLQSHQRDRTGELARLVAVGW